MQETYKFKNRSAYVEALDSVLPESYYKVRKHGSDSTTYIPAAIKESLADDLFHYWNVIDEDYQVVLGQVICTVKLCYMPNYPGADEHFCTGSAARPLGSAGNTLEYNVPGAKVEAISNALNTLGNIFGRNIGRKIAKNEYLANDFKIRKHAEQTESKQEAPDNGNAGTGNNTTEPF
jgi:hypothetical protein